VNGFVALIAPEGPADEIAAILRRQELEVSTFACSQALLDDHAHGAPPVLVLWVQDSSSPMASLIEPLKEHCALSPVIVVSAAIQRWDVRGALAAGASGIVLRGDLETALIPSIRAVAAGQICVPRGHWRQIEPPVLSTREKQILGLVVMGYMNSQIAARLFLAESTVKSHLSSAFGKLGVRSRNEAVELIINPERGLGMGILGLGGEPLQQVPAGAQ
jgi:DNA-binding NarL/FixJ family response regulator